MRRELIYVPPTPRRARKKPGPAARHRAKRRRAEDPVKRKVRAEVSERDGFCIFDSLDPCRGVSEWAHLEGKKRARTRGMKPEERHTTAGSAKACTRHHRLYDDGAIQIAMTDKGANGPIRAVYEGKVYMLSFIHRLAGAPGEQETP